MGSALRVRKPLILIADDDRDARDIYSRYLRAMGCSVLTAKNGAIAITKTIARRPDLVVMDLAMPVLDGWAATAKLKRSRPTAGIPIIALSAVETSGESARRVGCDAFLAKPCLPELLWWHVRALLGHHPRINRPAIPQRLS